MIDKSREPWRIGGTRVLFDNIVEGVCAGQTAEDLAESYDAVGIDVIRHVMGVIEQDPVMVNDYMKRRLDEERDMLLRNPEWAPVGLRERLESRRKLS